MKKGLIFTIVICISVLITLQTAYSEYERKVVFEEFSEVWCGPCASVAPVLGPSQSRTVHTSPLLPSPPPFPSPLPLLVRLLFINSLPVAAC